MAVIAQRAPFQQAPASRGYWAIAWHRFKKHKVAMAGGIVIVLFILMAVFAGPLTPFDFDQIDLYQRRASMTLAHPLGTDELGHDVLTRLLFAGRISLSVGFSAAT